MDARALKFTRPLKESGTGPEHKVGGRKRKAVPLCQVRLDRLILRCWASPDRKPPTIAGFRIISDCLVRPQGRTATYARVRQLLSLTSGTKIAWQYGRRHGWLTPWRITLFGDDRTGLTPEEVRRITGPRRFDRLVLLELAVDFDSLSGVDQEFVGRHAVFGKSRRRTDRGGPGQLRFGSRKSGKLIRCYPKEQVHAYRVEVELHSRLLRKNGISHVSHLPSVASLVFPKHFCFVRIAWPRLAGYLKHRFGQQGLTILERAHERANRDLGSATSYLRARGVKNVHRFLEAMALNHKVKRGLDQWATVFQGGEE